MLLMPMWLDTLVGLTHKRTGETFELLVDGDLLSLVRMLVLAGGAGTTAISKV